MSDYEKMTGDKKISEIETLININGEEKVLVAYNGQNYVISVARLINDGHTHSYTQLNDLQDLMDIVDAQYQHKKDSTLPTESKEVSGAIAEIYNLLPQLDTEELESLKNQLQDLANQVEGNSSQLEHKVNYIEIEESEFDLLDSNIIGESILFNLDNGLQFKKVWDSSIKQFAHHDTRNSTPILVAQSSQKYNFLINDYEAHSKLPTCLQLDENLNIIAENSWVRSTTTAQNCKYIIVNCEFANSIQISKAGE